MPRPRKNLTGFGNALASALADRGWTQRDLGEALGGVTQSAISAWRSGVAEPAPSTVFAIEEALRIPPGSLSRHLGYLPASTATGVTLPSALETDTYLSDVEKRAILALYTALTKDRTSDR